jgi:hypothetical protein
MDPARTFLSLMVLLALTLGGLVAAQLYRNSAVVRCRLSAAPGLAVRVDGRDVGVRTRGAGVELKLPPGHHRIALHGPGAPTEERLVEAVAGDACRVSFDAEP